MPIPCERGFIASGEMSSTGSLKDSCRHCGRTENWHKQQELKTKEIQQPSDEQAREFLELAGYKNAQYFELARVVLTRYIEWTKKQSI